MPEGPQAEAEDDRERHLGDQVAAEQEEELLRAAEHLQGFLRVGPLLPDGLPGTVELRAGLRHEVRDPERGDHEEDRDEHRRPVDP